MKTDHFMASAQNIDETKDAAVNPQCASWWRIQAEQVGKLDFIEDATTIVYMDFARSRKYLTLCMEHVAGYISFFSSSSILLSKSCSIVA